MRDNDPYRLEHMDALGNMYYVTESRAELSHLAHAMVKIDKFAPETCVVVANYYSLKGQREKAILNFQRGLRLNPRNAPILALIGHEYLELKNFPAAIESYRKVSDSTCVRHCISLSL